MLTSGEGGSLATISWSRAVIAGSDGSWSLGVWRSDWLPVFAGAADEEPSTLAVAGSLVGRRDRSMGERSSIGLFGVSLSAALAAVMVAGSELGDGGEGGLLVLSSWFRAAIAGSDGFWSLGVWRSDWRPVFAGAAGEEPSALAVAGSSCAGRRNRSAGERSSIGLSGASPSAALAAVMVAGSELGDVGSEGGLLVSNSWFRAAIAGSDGSWLGV